MNKSKYEGEYMKMLSGYRSRTAADKDLEMLKKIKGSGRITGFNVNKINSAIAKWGKKEEVKKMLKEIVFDLNREWDVSGGDTKLEQAIVGLEEIAGRL